MAVYFSGTWSRSGGLTNAIANQIKLINLKPARRITVKFDPFQENAKQAREFLFNITNTKVLATNPNCIIKTEVVNDRSEPEVNIKLAENGSIRFLAGNLTALEILQLINKHVTSLVPPDDTSSDLALTTTKAARLKRR